MPISSRNRIVARYVIAVAIVLGIPLLGRLLVNVGRIVNFFENKEFAVRFKEEASLEEAKRILVQQELVSPNTPITFSAFGTTYQDPITSIVSVRYSESPYDQRQRRNFLPKEATAKFKALIERIRVEQGIDCADPLWHFEYGRAECTVSTEKTRKEIEQIFAGYQGIQTDGIFLARYVEFISTGWKIHSRKNELLKNSLVESVGLAEKNFNPYFVKVGMESDFAGAFDIGFRWLFWIVLVMVLPIMILVFVRDWRRNTAD